MANKFSELRARMPKESQERAAVRAAEMIAAMPLQELRQTRKLSQETLAATLGQRQSGISKIEHGRICTSAHCGATSRPWADASIS